MELKTDVSLKKYNTFGVEAKSKKFCEVSSIDSLIEIVSQNKLPLLILGGGSNILFTKNFEGLVLKNNIQGIELLKEEGNDVYLKVGAGENWHDFVLFCVENNYGGIENLSLIPGKVGASPMQNIGAYGVEVKDVIVEVEALNIRNLSVRTFSNKECEFGYRSSIFKTTEKGNYIITSVIYRLSKVPRVNTSYGAIESELKRLRINNPTIKQISQAVINIRNSKLPNPAEIGNSGSFFKNPIVSLNVKNKLLAEYPSMPHYLQTTGEFKIAAGWLIELNGWKGKRINNYGVHNNQALVLVNYGGAEGKDILKLSEDIIQSISKKFEIILEREVNII